MIWTNPVPTNVFPNQTITIPDMSPYEAIIIGAKYYYSYERCEGYTIIPNVANAYGLLSAPFSYNKADPVWNQNMATRKAQITSNNTIWFHTPIFIDEYLGALSWDSNFEHAIPLHVYGLKKMPI